MSSSDVTECYHCNERVPDGSNYSLSINGKTEKFCCPACLAICETIITGGLEGFYLQRENKSAKSDSDALNLSLDEQFISRFIQTNNEVSSCKLFIENMHCTACAWLIEKHLSLQTGIIDATVNYQDQALFLTFNNKKIDIKTIFLAVKHIGYSLQAYQENQVYQQQQQQAKTLLKRLGISFILMMQIAMLSTALYGGDFFGISEQYKKLLTIFSMIFSLPVLYFSATPFFASALMGLRNKKLNMDLNISLAIIGLFSSSSYSVLTDQGEIYFDSVAMLCFFILLSRYIEIKSRLHLQKNSALLPETAKLWTNGTVEIVSAESIAIGDTILIEPGDTIAIDGKITEGESSCSEAILNGEAEAIKKIPGDKVYAASFNHNGILKVVTTSAQKQSVANSMKVAADNANQHRKENKNFADKVSGSFTSVMILLSLITYTYWQLQGSSNAYWIALSVLVVSCPCALSLAAPTANSVVQFFLKKSGIFIQGPQSIEKLSAITDICFDKTGTLSEGKFTISSIDNLSSQTNDALLNIACQLQKHSKHPVASAFKNNVTNSADNIIIHPHFGVSGTIDHTTYRLGNPEFCEQWHNASPPEKQRFALGLCNKKQFLGWFYLTDALRKDAKETIRFLQQRALKTHIISGDSSSDVDHFAKTLNITSYRKSMSSADKQNYVTTLQHNHKKLLMIGDGINDAEVLAHADISVTLFDASNWLKNSSEIVLMNNALSSLEKLFSISDKHQRILKQNFTWAILYNAIAIPFAMTGFLTPLLAAIGMSLSSVAVVLNSQRLRKD